MKCVIIAAGKGSRLQSKASSKPLLPLFGVALIERVIREAHQAGITEFCVITGHSQENLKSFLGQLAEKLDIPIATIENPDWAEAKNGTSVLKAKTFVQDNPFILLMADHLFDGAIVKRLLKNSPLPDEVILAVDTNLKNPLIDENDVTKVQVQSGIIESIQKQLGQYNAYDTGIFLCSPNLFSALEEAHKNNQTGLTDAILLLAHTKKVRALEIGDRFWIDVDDPVALSKAENALTQTLSHKTADGPVARYLNRPISIKISRWLARYPITPNQISIFSFGLSLLAAGLFTLGNYTMLAIGGLIAQFASIIDGCDGEIARLKYLSSQYGGWLDAVLDRYADGFLLFGLTLYAQAFGEYQGAALWAGFLAIIGSFVLSYTADKHDHLMRSKIQQTSRWRMGRDIRVFLIACIAVINQPFFGLCLIAVIMNIEVVRRLWACKDG
ncbi:MAG: NTP transferase domain-containing protein [Deltaproteobacteria bacterium]|nr:NTP transferase domain-containing protein [Deltaproteobacteria bacterium]